jgi:hypothetical protein
VVVIDPAQQAMPQLAVEQHETTDIVSEGKQKLPCFTRSETRITEHIQVCLVQF